MSIKSQVQKIVNAFGKAVSALPDATAADKPTRHTVTKVMTPEAFAAHAKAQLDDGTHTVDTFYAALGCPIKVRDDTTAYNVDGITIDGDAVTLRYRLTTYKHATLIVNLQGAN